MPATPFAAGSISLRLYPHDQAPAEVVAEIRAQSALAEAHGFDGVMTQEHHGGFPNYLPNPLLAATWALDATTSLWAAPCPILLPLRPWTQFVEDVAWSAHRFPGRLAVGVGAGAFPLDFKLAGVPFEELRSRFNAALPEVAAAFAGRASGPVGDDPAVAALAATPVPLVVAAQGPLTVARSARLGLGLVYTSLQTGQRTRELSDRHREAGGDGLPRILIKRVWVGTPPEEAVAAQMDRFRAVARPQVKAHWPSDGGLVHGHDGVAVAEQLHAELVDGDCTALNLRVFQAGLQPAQVREQIARLGAEVLPTLRARLART